MSIARPLTKAIAGPITRPITQAGAGGGGTPEGLRLLAENGDTLITESSDQLITD